ncbi:MAG TPA: hypothetical protein VG675_12740 [Bryobacteraceae bacterium]|nr:hypothetical protein [Bryobacteraceae bacterium]
MSSRVLALMLAASTISLGTSTAQIVTTTSNPPAPAAREGAEGRAAESRKPNGVHIGTEAFRDLERGFDNTLIGTGGGDPIDLLGATRGLYLPGYGVVFTTEVSLINTPTLNPFRQHITKEEAANVHKRKIEHLPLLEQAMRNMMVHSATLLESVPSGEKIVLAVRILYLPWEDTSGLPGQIVMTANRRELLTLASATAAIQTERE